MLRPHSIVKPAKHVIPRQLHEPKSQVVQHRPTRTPPGRYYYHLPEGDGSLYTCPLIVRTGSLLEQLWHGPNNFLHEVSAIGTHGCKFCACVFIRLNDEECFAAHLKAYIHVTRSEFKEGKSEWIPTPEEGEKLRRVVAKELRRWVAYHGVDPEEVNLEKSFLVCPDAIYRGQRSTGFHLCQGLRDVFGEITDKGTVAHGYIVDHESDKQIVLERGPETDEEGHLVEHPPEEYGFTRRNLFKYGESEAGADWSFVLDRGRWKPSKLFMAQKGDPRYVWRQDAFYGRWPFF